MRLGGWICTIRTRSEEDRQGVLEGWWPGSRVKTSCGQPSEDTSTCGRCSERLSTPLHCRTRRVLGACNATPSKPAVHRRTDVSWEYMPYNQGKPITRLRQRCYRSGKEKPLGIPQSSAPHLTHPSYSTGRYTRPPYRDCPQASPSPAGFRGFCASVSSATES